MGAERCRKAFAHRQCPGHHARGTHRQRPVQQRVRSPMHHGLLPHHAYARLHKREGVRVTRIPQAYYASRWCRNGQATARAQGPGRCTSWLASPRHRWTRHAYRSRWRCGIQYPIRRGQGRSRLCQCAARQPRGAETCARSHRRMPLNGRQEPHPLHSRCRSGWSVKRTSRARSRLWSWCHL